MLTCVLESPEWGVEKSVLGLQLAVDDKISGHQPFSPSYIKAAAAKVSDGEPESTHRSLLSNQSWLNVFYRPIKEDRLLIRCPHCVLRLKLMPRARLFGRR